MRFNSDFMLGKMRAREINFYGCTQAHLTVNFDRSTTLFYDSVSHTQAQAGTFTFRFGSKKRFKYSFNRFRGHTTPGIGYCQQHILPGDYIFIVGAVNIVQHDIAGFYG